MKQIALLLLAALVSFAACKKETTKCWNCMMNFDKTGKPWSKDSIATCNPNEVVHYLITPYQYVGYDTSNGTTLHWVCNEK